MTIAMTIPWWVIPAAITFLALCWAFFWPVDDDGIGGCIVRLLMLVPALGISAVSWAITGLMQ